jgi:Ran GTPase-activating protein (RanGAP) involved in mRNA processing and transport
VADRNLNASDAHLVASIVKTNKSITSLDISGNNLKVQGSVALCEALTYNLNMDRITLGRACITPVDNPPEEMNPSILTRSIPVRQIRKNILDRLDLDKDFPPEGVLILASILKDNTSVIKMSLAGQLMGTAGQQELIAVLQTKRYFVDVEFDGTAIRLGSNPFKNVTKDVQSTVMVGGLGSMLSPSGRARR